MKKISLIAALLIAGLLLQECKKDTYTEYAQSTSLMIAVINDSTWTTDTVTATVTYTAATKSKVFACAGMGNNKKVIFSALQNYSVSNAGNTSGFPLTTYNLNNDTPATSNAAMSYYTYQKSTGGGYVYTQQGTVAPGSGTITITAIDSVNKLITGTFSFTSSSVTIDSGKITSTTINQVQAGGFNNLPYKFISQ